MKLRLLSGVLVFALSLRSSAHDFWIEPSSHAIAPNEVLRVTLKVGDHALGDSVPRSESRIVDFSARSGGATLPIVGREGFEPAGFVRLESSGMCLLGYRSNHAAVELEPAKFADYLREKGLEHVLAARSAAGESEQRVREIYSRCAKSLVRVGQGPTTGFDSMLGHPLELIPERNPSDLHWTEDQGVRVLEMLPVRLYYDGRPLANALVGALDLDAEPPTDGTHQAPIEVRTDAEGRARLRLPHGGRWLLAAVHLVRPSDRASADWESFWASLTFAVPPR